MKANTLSDTAHCNFFNSFQLGSNSQIPTFGGHAPLILLSQGASHLPSPFKNTNLVLNNLHLTMVAGLRNVTLLNHCCLFKKLRNY